MTEVASIGTMDGSLLEAVALPGAAPEHLGRLIGGFTLQQLLQLNAAVDAMTRLAPRDHATRLLSALLHRLAGMPATEISDLLSRPRVMAWLGRMQADVEALAGCRDADQSRALMDRAKRTIFQARLLFAGTDANSEQEPSPWTFRLASGQAMGPAKAAWLLRNKNKNRGLTLTAELRGGRLALRHGRAPELNLALSSSELPECRPREHCRLRVERIPLIAKSAIEVLAADDYPELSALRLPAERPSDLRNDILDAEISRALQAIRAYWPEAGADVGSLFRGLLPMSMPDERWNSASTNQLPYILQLTVRDGGTPMLLAESILHEISHVKLDIAMSLTPLLEDSGERIHFHPWRPDPRPITGVLLGAHAFLAVLTFYRRALRREPDNRFVRREAETRRREVGSALDTLARHARFTAEGADLFGMMTRAYAA